jgi:2-dehydrotetronate isomerase
MPRFAANLNFLYAEYSSLAARIAASAGDGFRAVEIPFPYADIDVKAIRTHLFAHQQSCVLINTHPGPDLTVDWQTAWAEGWRGIAACPGYEVAFRQSLSASLAAAKHLDCRQIHVMAGVVVNGEVEDAGPAFDTYLTNLTWATQQAAKNAITLLIEPINRTDMPGYFLNRQEQASAVVRRINSAHLRILLDLYHCQMEQGQLTAHLRAGLASGLIAHLQVAGVPGRHEPDGGEINADHLFRVIDDMGYGGWVGLEYRPRAGGVRDATHHGLQWLRKRSVTEAENAVRCSKPN